jgi:hypothetical protein
LRTPIPPDKYMRPVAYPLPEGTIPDMRCGVSSKAESWSGSQEFRPQYVTFEVLGSQLREFRIWGQRVLKDGTLGVEHLDFVWRF